MLSILLMRVPHRSHLAVIMCLHMRHPSRRSIVFVAAHLCDAVTEQQEHRATPYGGLRPSGICARPPACCFAAACYFWSFWECCIVGLRLVRVQEGGSESSRTAGQQLKVTGVWVLCDVLGLNLMGFVRDV